jgi:hypothetical protein
VGRASCPPFNPLRADDACQAPPPAVRAHPARVQRFRGLLSSYLFARASGRLVRLPNSMPCAFFAARASRVRPGRPPRLAMTLTKLGCRLPDRQGAFLHSTADV